MEMDEGLLEPLQMIFDADKSPMLRTATAVFMFLMLVFQCQSSSGIGPENILLVVYSRSPESLAVANYYVHFRNIPSQNVVYLDKLTTTTLKKFSGGNIKTRLFHSEIIQPVWAAIKARGLEGQIDCIVYSAGFPTRIDLRPEWGQMLKQNGKPDSRKPAHWGWGSITSQTYLADQLFSPSIKIFESNANWYANPPIRNVLLNPFIGETAKRFESARQSFQDGDYENASLLFAQLVEQNPQQITVRYFLAKSLAMKGDKSQAIKQLSLCQKHGWSYRSHVSDDASFAELKGDNNFQNILKTMPDQPMGKLPSRGFSSTAAWSKNGWPNGEKSQGRQYILSTMLAVVGENKSTLEQALKQIESSAEVDGSKPEGQFYFAKHRNVRSRIRHGQIDQAANELKTMGFDVEIGNQEWPINNKRVLGATLGSGAIKWSESKSQFVPGAICDNLTSAGGIWRKPELKPGQTPLTDYLNAGAAGASGTVYEPYAITAKFPTARLHVHYARGCTLAESIYQTVSSPYQLLIVGDPLCCPFGDFPEFEITGLKPQTVIKNDFDLKLVPKDGGPEISHFELFFDGRYWTTVDKPQKIRISTADMSDGFHELRVVAIRNSLIATRQSKKLEFVLNRNGHSVAIESLRKRFRLGEKVVITGQSSRRGDLEVRQNARVVGKITGDTGKLSIDSRLLGQGKTKLQGFIAVGNKKVGSLPIEIEILP